MEIKREKTVTTSISLLKNQMPEIEERINRDFEGNLSRYVRELIRKDLAGHSYSVMHEDPPDYGSKGKSGKDRTVAIKLPRS